jgi:DNA-binding NarL/FixJ family response regulator
MNETLREYLESKNLPTALHVIERLTTNPFEGEQMTPIVILNSEITKARKEIRILSEASLPDLEEWKTFLKLSSQEIRVALLLLRGYTNIRMTEFIKNKDGTSTSMHTIKSHVNGVMIKLGINDRQRTIPFLQRLGINSNQDQRILDVVFLDIELEVIILVLQNKTNQEIADLLQISVDTVKSRIKQISKKCSSITHLSGRSLINTKLSHLRSGIDCQEESQ